MIIKVLGSGCKKCGLLEENARKAVAQLGVEATIEKVTDMDDILSFGVMRTPALVVNDKVVLSGTIASPQKIAALLEA